MADKVAQMVVWSVLWTRAVPKGPTCSTPPSKSTLRGKSPKFQLVVFNLSNGPSMLTRSLRQWLIWHSGGFNPDQRDADLTFNAKDEPATLPRIQQLYIITDITPWCTTVKNDRGVTMNDICHAKRCGESKYSWSSSRWAR
ncbi:hypothetical protein F5146DRAFT_1198355 [Armillaria mellea]|nr:hypothetical protein F5146DRAFT_1198355 [Armillaria mellea]